MTISNFGASRPALGVPNPTRDKEEKTLMRVEAEGGEEVCLMGYGDNVTEETHTAVHLYQVQQ